MGCASFYTQLNNINSAIKSLGILGLQLDDPIMGQLNKLRRELLGRYAAGVALPRININLKTIRGLSPGLVRIWFDIETGFFTEGRATEEARPTYNMITTEEASRLLRGDPDVDLAHEYMAKIPVIDN